MQQSLTAFTVLALLGSTAGFQTFTGQQVQVPKSVVRNALQKLEMVAASPVATEALTQAATEARGLAMDSITKAHSGHLGLPLGCAEIGAVLYGNILQQFPDDPTWVNRDRFILSAGHGSMFVYSWLHLAGYDLPLEEVKNFRVHHSMTPGHPEFPNSEHNTPGIESTTGPLGQGVANAIGMGAAQKMAEAVYNTEKHTLFDNHIIALCGDGCMQEGVVAEAAAIAAHERLDNVIVVYDANDVTLDSMAIKSQSEDTAMRFQSYGWDVVTINGHDMAAVQEALESAKSNDNGKPKLIIAKTIIGKGIEEVEGTNAAHGEAGVGYTKDAKVKLGLPEGTEWYVSEETREYFAKHKEAQKEKYDSWMAMYEEYKAENPELAKQLEDAKAQKVPTVEELFAGIPVHEGGDIATRIAGSNVITPIADMVPSYVSGSADLHGSTKNLIKNGGDWGHPWNCESKSYAGKNFYYGIREHAMGAMMNGMAYFGLNRPSGATFLVFADYLRATIRVAALAELGTGYILTHDSVGVGEDGPTHQPVETVSGLRVIPNLDVIRPADPEETAGAYVANIVRTDGPTALILTRQNVRTLSEIPVETRRNGVLKGAYIAKKETGDLDMIILASGSELQWAMDAAAELGEGVRVVSVPCFERFDRQSEEYKAEVLPASCTKRVAIEAGVTPLWYKYVGLDGKVIGTDKFGFSAPGDTVMKEFGITAENLVAVAKSL
mmetsp:Transcript_35670/g.45398  ORF Transcript_35670/g.45398 Transcript_35670/m.45398 type:complete len:721 (+) Transcript_35670:88-2250(+)